MNQYQQSEKLKKHLNRNLLFWGRCSKLKACNIGVAASGVFFYARKYLWGLKRGPPMPGEAKIHVQNDYCYSVSLFGGKMFIFHTARTLSLPPPMGLPQRCGLSSSCITKLRCCASYLNDSRASFQHIPLDIIAGLHYSVVFLSFMVFSCCGPHSLVCS